MTETVDITFLGKQIEKALLELRKLRGELGDVRTLTLQNTDYARRLDRNSHELKDDLELMLKAEIIGRLGHFETRMEQMLDDKLDALRADLPGLVTAAVRQALDERG